MVPVEDRLEKVEDRLTKHDERFNQHSQRFERHEELLDEDKKEIQKLNKRDEEKHVRLLDVEENYKKLETTVAKENEETRATMRDQTSRLYTIVEQAMGHQESRSTQSHELRMAKLNVFSTVFLKVSAGISGLGGVAYYIVQHVIEN